MKLALIVLSATTLAISFQPSVKAETEGLNVCQLGYSFTEPPSKILAWQSTDDYGNLTWKGKAYENLDDSLIIEVPRSCKFAYTSSGNKIKLVLKPRF